MTFTQPPVRAAVAMEGWQLEFEPPGPTARRLDVMQADTQFVQIVGNDVLYQFSVELTDFGGNPNYSASVNTFVIAEVRSTNLLDVLA